MHYDDDAILDGFATISDTFAADMAEVDHETIIATTAGGAFRVSVDASAEEPYAVNRYGSFEAALACSDGSASVDGAFLDDAAAVIAWINERTPAETPSDPCALCGERAIASDALDVDDYDDPMSLCSQCRAHDLAAVVALNTAFGRRCDVYDNTFSVPTWTVRDGLYVHDGEDGTYSLQAWSNTGDGVDAEVEHAGDVDYVDAVVTLLVVPAAEIKRLIDAARALGPVKFWIQVN